MNIGLLHTIYKDYRRFRVSDQNHPIKVIFFTQGFWAVVVYRVFHFAYYSIEIPFVRQLLLALCYIAQKIIEITTGIYLPGRCHIGAGLHISHFGPIILNTTCILGENCNISQGITIGIKQSGSNKGVPKIGNRVYIGPNAIVIGGIEIGDDAAIGAGAIVTKSVPPRGVVVGNPARLISQKGSFDYVHYDGMENDIDRMHALQLALQED